MKLITLVFFLVIISLSFLLVSCTTINEDEGSAQDLTKETAAEESVSEELPAETNKTESTETSKSKAVEKGLCEPGWKCISSKYKAYRDKNCVFNKKTECPLGCVNDTCKAGATCAVGFKCLNNKWSGYQKEDCDWINKEFCEFGCLKGDCLNATEGQVPVENVAEETASESSNTEEESSSSSAAASYNVLNWGDKVSIDSHNLSIYLLEEERVKITLDSKNSNWLVVEDSYARNGLNVTIKEIMFQSYEGGKKAISYTAG